MNRGQGPNKGPNSSLTKKLNNKFNEDQCNFKKKTVNLLRYGDINYI